MSPLLLRRYRADRLLREQFETLRGRVIGSVEARLRAAGAALDRSDLEAAYAQAWQGLHAAVLEGQQIANPTGWLTVVTRRRALDEHRLRRAAPAAPDVGGGAGAPARQRDLAEQLDDRARLHALLEALRGRLNERERQAAALCYLQGLSRVEAATQMGVSASRMRKLMDGAGKGLRGVAAKVGELVQAIAGGEWCEEQGSLMRGLAFGILDPQGDRYQLAIGHSDACPACRAYVLSLRGLAAVLPPVPVMLHPILAAAGGGGAGTAALAGTGSAGAGAGGSAGATSAPLASAGVGTLSASGAAGAGAAGGGWWLAGGVGAKLAAGCLLALGVGAGCVALEGHDHDATKAAHGHVRKARPVVAGRAASGAATAGLVAGSSRATSQTDGRGEAPPAGDAVTAKTQANREFGLERTPSSTPATSGQKTQQASGGAVASSASTHASGGAPVPVPTGGAGTSSSGSSSPSQSAAAREFAPG